MSDVLDSTRIGACLARLRDGDNTARNELLTIASNRLEKLAHKMLRGEFNRVGRWLDTADVFQVAALRLWKALADVIPESPLHLHRLAARLIRLELLDLVRHYYGPQGLGANYESDPAVRPGNADSTPVPSDPVAPVNNPVQGLQWAELHELVQNLPDEEAAVTDLLFYQGLTQEDAAGLLAVDVRTIQRRWQRARRKLGELLSNEE
ncbi:MAG TPA: sigma-70 family RNA polymerase sigma factor [Gemmata sp.]|jgi:RNA polymerase sigma-70 factor (ECF subfamily)|nr:sigma-70 family RNA polymerase sigma factor [Gemmata sp.]